MHACNFQECLMLQKPAGSKSSTHQQERGRQRRDDSFLNRYGNDYPRQLNRQNSFELYDGE